MFEGLSWIDLCHFVKIKPEKLEPLMGNDFQKLTLIDMYLSCVELIHEEKACSI
jgi:hypothetical protein